MNFGLKVELGGKDTFKVHNGTKILNEREVNGILSYTEVMSPALISAPMSSLLAKEGGSEEHGASAKGKQANGYRLVKNGGSSERETGFH